jgi:hypothetical protein
MKPLSNAQTGKVADQRARSNAPTRRRSLFRCSQFFALNRRIHPHG